MSRILLDHPVFGSSVLTFVLFDADLSSAGVNVWRMELFDNDDVSRFTLFFECGNNVDYTAVVASGLLRINLGECF